MKPTILDRIGWLKNNYSAYTKSHQPYQIDMALEEARKIVDGLLKEKYSRCEYCGNEIFDEPHYDCQAEFKMIRAKEDRADMEEAMNHEPDYDEVIDENPYEEEVQND